MLKKSVEEKIINYVSSPRKGRMISARTLARYIREPLEHVEYFLCLLTDAGMIRAVRDKDTDEYWLIHSWQKGAIKKQVRP